MSCAAEIICGECSEVMRGMKAESVHMAVTSPPYGGLRSYKGRVEWDVEAVAKALYQVLVPGGVVCWNVGDETVDGSESLVPFKQALVFKEAAGFRMHDTMIWHKPNFSNPSHNRYHQVFEYVFVFSKGAPRVFNPICDKLNKYGTCFGRNTFRAVNGDMKERAKNAGREFGMRHNVWQGNTRGQEEMCESLPHPAMMARWLARDLILSWSDAGDTVLDPFAGSGTTGEEAVTVGRNAVLIEREAEYAEVMRESMNTVTPGLGF
jgi:DNA modification methylase